MIPRGKLYIAYADLLAGIGYCLRDAFGTRGSNYAAQNPDKLLCLSVRTGFDLVFRVLNLQPGSEVLVTDINIPDMFNIIAAHQLVAVPLAVNKFTLNIDARDVEAAITPRTKAILITNLFGCIMDTREIVRIAKANNLVVFEDCAQAYAGNLYTGDPLTDVVMFSFGFIKTDTAISGAMLRINDAQLRAQLTALNDSYPQQQTGSYFKKLCKVMFVKLLTKKSIYTLLYKITRAAKKDFDDVLAGFTKGFPDDDLLKQIRYRPAKPNIKLLERRLLNFDATVIEARTKKAHDVLNHIPDHYKIGALNAKHSYWVLPIETTRADELIAYLRGNGFDASQKASSLVRFSDLPAGGRADYLSLQNLVYLPMSDALDDKARTQLAALLTEFDG